MLPLMRPKKKILLVDDDAAVLDLVVEWLKSRGHEAIATSYAAEAVALAQDHNVDLIILDLIMPEVGGADAAAALSQDPATKDIPVIFLTGLVGKGEEPLGIAAGKGHRMIAKSCDREEFLTAVDEVLAQNQARKGEGHGQKNTDDR